MATYLVTGAAGFIASKVCAQLLTEGHTVVGVDNLNDYYDVRLKDYRLSRLLDLPFKNETAYGYSRFLSQKRFVHDRFIFEALDIEDRPQLQPLFTEFAFDAIFNLAARAGVQPSMSNPYIYVSTNTVGGLNLLELMRTAGTKKLVLASTSSLYANTVGPSKEDVPVHKPISPYAATKMAAELLAHCYHHLYGMDVTIVRYFTVFGPAGRPDMSIFRFIKWIDEGRPVILYGDGTQERDFTYVDDIARGTVAGCALKGYEIVNLGGGRTPLPLLAVISFIEKSLGKQAIIEQRPFHGSDMRSSSADISKAFQLLGWRPSVSTEDGLARCIQWYKENSFWLGDVKV